MAKGYWIARIDVHNMDGYKEYVAQNGAVFAKYGAKFLVRGGKHEAREGVARSRNVVLEFKDYETALACYNSPEYARLVLHIIDNAMLNGETIRLDGALRMAAK